MSQINEDFLFKSVRKYNRSARQSQRDVILNAVAVHVDLEGFEKKRSPLPTLTDDERRIILDFLRQFLASQKLEVVLKD